jgi:cytochrome d ubiquinol oxidase subunit I
VDEKGTVMSRREPTARRGSAALKFLGALGLMGLAFQLFPDVAWAQDIPMREYGDFPMVGSRVAVWIAAQVHLLFAAFVLGVPMFAIVAEAVGIFGGHEKYDKLAKEFTRLLLVAYSATAIWGAILSFLLVTLYPRLWIYLAEIFEVSMWIYVGLFFLESFTLFLY